MSRRWSTKSQTKLSTRLQPAHRQPGVLCVSEEIFRNGPPNILPKERGRTGSGSPSSLGADIFSSVLLAILGGVSRVRRHNHGAIVQKMSQLGSTCKITGRAH